jgi:glycerol 3-phosphatase-2
LSVVRAVAGAVWDADFDGQPFTVRPGDPGDDNARDALQRWSLMQTD